MEPMFIAKPELKHIFDLSVEVESPYNVGETPMGNRRIIQVSGGEFHGHELKGKVLYGDDWILIRQDGVLVQDVRLMLETDDHELIQMTYRGLRHGPDMVMERLDKGEDVDLDEYYFRTTITFETSSKKYAWLNKTITVAAGKRVPGAALYSVYSVS